MRLENKIAVVTGALGGIGLFCWNMMAKQKESWVPLALIGAAGLVTLLLLLVMMTAGSAVASSTFLSGGENFDVDMTLLGFWLPFAGAAAATVAAVKQITSA